MRARTHLLILAMAGLLPSAAVAQAPEPLRLRPGDAVRLLIAEDSLLSGDYPVAEDGDALFPIVGLLRVGGRDFTDVRRDLAAALSRELRGPGFQITPLMRVAVLGEVRAPGLYLIDPTFAVSDVLAQAGGLLESANPRGIRLLRVGGEPRAVDPARPDVALRPGDQLIVARRSWVRENMSIFVGAIASVAAAAATALIVQR